MVQRIVFSVGFVVMLWCPKPAHAGWIGEEAAAIIAALQPLLNTVSNTLSSVKDKLKFKELIAEVEAAKKIDQNILQETADTAIQTKNLYDDIRKYVETGDEVVQVLLNPNLREEWLWDQLYGFETETITPELRAVLEKLYHGHDVTLKDAETLYERMTLSDREQMIRELKKQGYTDAEIQAIVYHRAKMDKTFRRLVEHQKLRVRNLKQIDINIKQVRHLKTQIDKVDGKRRTEIVKMITFYETSTSQLTKDIFGLNRDIATLKSQLDDIQKAIYAKIEEKQIQYIYTLEDQEYQAYRDKYVTDRLGTSGYTMQKANDVFHRYMLKRTGR